ncbi:hypothetical protein TTHERM_00450960 (macronuclear) [Tetrahymena thermophila SB210]|uniref:Uncharacterized protein n=1 Tax=Tetrahymena thermophila (strain SB210) TaxID=312017 RepID=Q238S3_TETTS|nr:hypothetical protein TTHERM_00450960 [Tetrahymena thermophila SB210]EAR93147.2 hypothetical protein TTHERM_00450960 [Tetrahymena thermophila SB210]|eukprot:XP_001013392.2 hypothetical protein TTHERM_00450960 [Tetrahymena thermophila SB210]
MDSKRQQQLQSFNNEPKIESNKPKSQQKISQYDNSYLSRSEDESQYYASQYNERKPFDYIQGDSFISKDEEVIQNPKTVKFVSGLKDHDVEKKLSSLYIVDKDMIQMPVINLPKSNQYGIEENIHFQKEDLTLDKERVWKSLTKEILNPFVSQLKPLVSQQTDIDKLIEQDNHMKFKILSSKNSAKEKMLKVINQSPQHHQSLLQKNQNHRVSNSLDHFFKYIIQDSQQNNLNVKQDINKPRKSNLQVGNENGGRRKKGSILQTATSSSQKKAVKNLSQAIQQVKQQQNVTPFLTLLEEDKLMKQENLKSIQSPRVNQNSQVSPLTQEANLKLKKAAVSNVASPQLPAKTATKQENINNDVFEILDRKYRKKYNMEYKMQLRRKSCYCSQCGQCTQYENKYQNIVNPILIRKKKRFTKVFKVVNFLNIMNRTVKQIPSQQEIENESQGSVNIPSVLEESDSNLKQGSQKLIQGPHRKSIIGPPSLSKIELNNITEESPVRKAKKQMTQVNLKIQTNNKQEEFKKPTHKIRKSFTQHFDDDTYSIDKNKNDFIKDLDSSDYSPTNIRRNDSDESQSILFDRRQHSFAMEINSDHDFSQNNTRHKVVDARNKRGSSYNQHKSTFLNFIEKKIQEAKQKRKEEEIKYVGKTPLTLLLQILSKGKRDSVFTGADEQEKKIQQYIQNKKPHLKQSLYKERINNENQNPELNSELFITEKGYNTYSSSQLSNKNIGDETNNIEIHEQFSSDRKKINSPSNYFKNSIPPLALFKRKLNKKEAFKSIKERNFVISPIQARTFDQMNGTLTSNSTKSQNGFSSTKKQLLESALNPLKLVKKKIEESKEKDPYLQQRIIQIESSENKHHKKVSSHRENKIINTDRSSKNNYYINNGSQTTLRQTNTAQTTDRSSFFSSSNKKQKSDINRGQQLFIRNKLVNSASKNNLNKTDFQNSNDKFQNLQITENNIQLNQSFAPRNLTPSSSLKKLIPRFQQLFEDPSLKAKTNPYLQQLFKSQTQSTKQSEYIQSTNNQQFKSQKYFKSSQTNRQ